MTVLLCAGPRVYTLSLPAEEVNNELITLPQVQYGAECLQIFIVVHRPSRSAQFTLLIHCSVQLCLILGSHNLVAAWSQR